MTQNQAPDERRRRQQRYARLLDQLPAAPYDHPALADQQWYLIERSVINGSLIVTLHDSQADAGTYHATQERREDWAIDQLVDLDTGDEWDAHCQIEWAPVGQPTPAADRQITDRYALDLIAHHLRAPEWPGASGMEDVRDIVERTGRDMTVDPTIEWHRH